jgi:hypothetical protein
VVVEGVSSRFGCVCKLLSNMPMKHHRHGACIWLPGGACHDCLTDRRRYLADCTHTHDQC